MHDDSLTFGPRQLEMWRSRYQEVLRFMQERASWKSVLVEAAAQHPLIDGRVPNHEFATRLDLTAHIYEKLSSAGSYVEVYVPGSRHMHNGRPDDVSLSEAGVAYLRSSGVPSEALHGDDLNERYKSREGVYGSADECFVSAEYFKCGNFGTLMCVVSPEQLSRKLLHYLQFGVLPLAYTAPVLMPFHDLIEELMVAVPEVIASDMTLQDADSEVARALRERRKPRW